ANIANGLVQTVDQYAWLRLIAGIGLAGELGAGITLVSEVLPTEKRGYGTTLVATVGIFGAILAANVGEIFHWRTAYFLGGGLGIALLVLRVSVFESALFSAVKKQAKSRGNFLALFSSAERFRRYLSCILIGVPVWFSMGILVTFVPEFAKERGLTEPVSAGRAIMFTYIGSALGDLLSGLLSQLLRSRRQVVLGFILVIFAFVAAFLSMDWKSASSVYGLCFGIGLGTGYWAVFVTIAAEQFGTNLRATVTTTVPNFVRGSVVPLSLLFSALRPQLGMIGSAWAVAALTLVLSFWALSSLEETFSKDLDYLEQI
ncbi:MAG: MFS transporter, partial [Bdellovibrionales bacterium]|nr:MFS transporter [Bdellovibrionales bacterium]